MQFSCLPNSHQPPSQLQECRSANSVIHLFAEQVTVGSNYNPSWSDVSNNFNKTRLNSIEALPDNHKTRHGNSSINVFIPAYTPPNPEM